MHSKSVSKLYTSCLVLAAAIVSGLLGCQTLQIDSKRMLPGEDVLVYGGDSYRHHYMNAVVTPPFEEAWRYNATAAFGPGSALLYRDAVIVGNRNGELHAVGLEDGRKIGFRRLGESLEGPLLIEGGCVYVTNAWGKYVLTAYDLDKGERKWRARGIPFETAPVLIGKVLVAVDVEGHIRAFDSETGEEIWNVSLGEHVSGQTSPIALDEDRVFVVLDTGLAAVLSIESGATIWTRDLGSPVYASPAAVGDLLIVPTTRGRLIGLSSANGETSWQFSADNEWIRFAPPATDGNSIYVGSSEGSLYRLSASNGALQWRFEAPDAIVAPTLVTETHFFVGTMGRMLYAFDRSTGDMVWESELKGRIKSGMAAKDGYLVVLTEPRYVYGFKTERPDA